MSFYIIAIISDIVHILLLIQYNISRYVLLQSININIRPFLVILSDTIGAVQYHQIFFLIKQLTIPGLLLLYCLIRMDKFLKLIWRQKYKWDRQHLVLVYFYRESNPSIDAPTRRTFLINIQFCDNVESDCDMIKSIEIQLSCIIAHGIHIRIFRCHFYVLHTGCYTAEKLKKWS